MLAIVLLVVLGVLHESNQVNAAAPAGCCTMDSSDTCVWDLTSPWISTLSGRFPVTTDYAGFGTAPDSTYFFLQDIPGAVLNSSGPIQIDTQYTVISFDYYFYTSNPSPDSYLNIYFQSTTFAGRVLLSDTNIPIDQWIHKDIPCNDNNNYCCGLLSRFPCYGTFQVVGSLGVSPPTGLMAVDNIGTCATPPTPCCRFTDNGVCGFTNPVSNTVDWYWFGFPPVYPPPLSPSGGYVYYEANDSPFGQIVDNTFRSDSITIASTVAFVGGFYVDTPYGNAGDSGLKINFVNSNTGIRHEMAYYKTTSGSWQTLSFSCPSGNCCDGFSTCAGWLEFVAHVDYPGGYAFYGVSFFGETGYPCPV